MLCFHLKKTDPYFCLAAEEYLLKNFDDDIFMLWQSNNSIVLGKHQNALAEINYPFVRENNIAVCRRISGGGTVFHDAGNVNFTFIKNVKSPAEVSFSQFTFPVVEALAQLGIETTTSGRNDLLVKGKKISGNAEHVYKNRVLHHGTLLFNSDLQNLGLSIKVISGKYESKAVQSNRSEVANISSFLDSKLNINQFIRFLLEVQLKKDENREFGFSAEDEQKIEMLAEEKFRKWDWNYGYSPKYTFANNAEADGKKLNIRLAIERGMIVDCELSGDYFSSETIRLISLRLKDRRHIFEDLFKVLNDVPVSQRREMVYRFF